MGTTTDIVIVVAMLAGFAAFGVVMLAVALRWGPRRGTWNQPAAALRRPGARLAASMYVLAGVHVVLGLVLATSFEGGGLAIFLAMCVMGAFYAMCAQCWTIAQRLVRRRDQRDPAT
jgi:hypothetical protein